MYAHAQTVPGIRRFREAATFSSRVRIASFSFLVLNSLRPSRFISSSFEGRRRHLSRPKPGGPKRVTPVPSPKGARRPIIKNRRLCWAKQSDELLFYTLGNDVG